jgi:SPP1 family predicted phage head-tail adaptor
MTLACEYRHSVTITAPNVTGVSPRGSDQLGTPTTIGTVLAKIESLSGRKLELARQLVSMATHEVTIRYLCGCIPEGQVIFGSRTFNIGAVLDKMENQFEMALICVEVV